MTDLLPIFTCRYYLTLEEAKEGFALATFGKQKFTRFITPIISIAIIAWGLSMGMAGVGKYYVVLGSVFLLLQIALRFLLLPRLFERQYTRYKFGDTEQGITLYQDYGVLLANAREQKFNYSDVNKFSKGQKSYMLELRDSTVIIVSKQAVEKTGQMDFFESVFSKR